MMLPCDDEDDDEEVLPQEPRPLRHRCPSLAANLALAASAVPQQASSKEPLTEPRPVRLTWSCLELNLISNMEEQFKCIMCNGECLCLSIEDVKLVKSSTSRE